MQNSISLLIGSGFSVPQGYPTGKKLNNLLLNCDGSTFSFSTDGRLMIDRMGGKPSYGYKTEFDYHFDFCKDLIQYFNESIGYFDYEEFYDFFRQEASNDEQVKKMFLDGSYGSTRELSQMLYHLNVIYNQLVTHYLKDKNGISWYNSDSQIDSSEYIGFLNCLRNFSMKDILNIHTLNHDLFFESLNYTNWIEEKICDGFEELGSPYYGRLKSKEGEFMCRLECFRDNYSGSFRLYKLHGSKNYVLYNETSTGVLTPDKYIKTKYGIGHTELYKEKVNQDQEVKYDNDWTNYHSDFLTGTTAKIKRYKEPLLYDLLFNHFKENLKHAKMLIIIGYGGKDSEINKMIYENFDFKNKSSFIIDPHPGDDVKALKDKLNSKLIDAKLENLTLEMFT